METIKYNDPQIDPSANIEHGCILGVDGINKSNSSLKIGKNANLRSQTIIYNGSSIGENFVTGNKVNIRENCSIGSNVSIGTGSVIEHNVEIENNVRLHSLCFVCELTILKEGCWIGPRVTFTNAKFPNQIDTKNNLTGVIVEKGAIIGAGCILLPGVKIGVRSFIGAGSVVTSDVKDGETVFGNPAKKQTK